MNSRQGMEVFLHGRHIGMLTGTSLRLAFQYDADVVAEYGSGATLLSLSLPLSRKKLTGPSVYNYFDGLLPEGQVRSQLAMDNGVSAPDALGLLRVLGADCAGAVQVLPAGVNPQQAGNGKSLTHGEVANIVEALPTWDLPEDFMITASLGGVQSKVLLSRIDGGWSWPGSGAVSTHIIKPDPLDSPVPHLLASEDWALKVASAAGLPAAESWLETFGSRRAIVVKRFDRTAAGGRVHQEDFTQALGLSSANKYEGTTASPSRLTKLTSLAAPHTRDEEEFLRQLLRAVTFNALIGNGDAHSKNYAVLILDGGEVRLAPLYDAAPTLLLHSASVNAGHTLGGQIRLPYLTFEHLVNEGVAWGLQGSEARLTATQALESAAEAAAATPSVEEISFLRELVPARAQDLLNGRTARRSLA
ncbi:serine/threonine-protein kinase HipA [Arthrobacter pigmenti]|uniref:Serine/threonine-protein kinase HipA n=1 Tax=Arthrobacter pigmenti TaxID=271432 RepID=A0A846RUK8_9MICC|nr:serine/threonine-protein kinase HipA [Arthrobacter pigmenti]